MSGSEFKGFEKFDAWIETAIRALSPAGRKQLLGDIAREVRRRNQQRITRQQDPDGNKWQPRKPDHEGNIRGAKKMMLGFRKARRMRIETSPSHAAVGFKGMTGKIASVHHHGSVDYVEKGGPRVKYPERPLLGIPTADLHMIRQRILDAIITGS